MTTKVNGNDVSLFADANKYIWLGARDVNKNNTYYWVNGAPVTFNDWRFGHPDGVPSGAGGNCISSLV